MSTEPTTIRQRLEAIDRLSDPLPKSVAEVFDRLCLICEEVEAALAILDNADKWKRPSEPDYTGIAWRDQSGTLLLLPDPVRLVGRVEPHDDNGDTP